MSLKIQFRIDFNS